MEAISQDPVVNRPAPGWYPDNVTPGRLRWWDGTAWSPHTTPGGYALSGPTEPPGERLDRAVAAMKAEDPAPWGARPVVVPIVTIAAVIVIGLLVSAFVGPFHGAAQIAFALGANITVYGLFAVAVYLAGRPVARRVGSWARAFGWRRPTVRDLLPALAGLGVVFALRIGWGILTNLVSGGRAAKEASNLNVDHPSVLGVVLLVVLTVIIAPLSEELIFRGLLLRTFMRRWSFWPSALASSAIFAAFHTYEVSTVLGAITLAGAVGLMGLVNCVLNRRTDSLVPGMLVHAALNALAVTAAVALS